MIKAAAFALNTQGDMQARMRCQNEMVVISEGLDGRSANNPH